MAVPLNHSLRIHISLVPPLSFDAHSQDIKRIFLGILAAAYVNGLQSNGVASNIKHLVGNDQEHERTAADSVISDRALREIYLYPCVYAHTIELHAPFKTLPIYRFMLAQKLAKPWSFMTS